MCRPAEQAGEERRIGILGEVRSLHRNASLVNVDNSGGIVPVKAFPLSLRYTNLVRSTDGSSVGLKDGQKSAVQSVKGLGLVWALPSADASRRRRRRV